jgi:hypothetical protein
MHLGQCVPCPTQEACNIELYIMRYFDVYVNIVISAARSTLLLRRVQEGRLNATLQECDMRVPAGKSGEEGCTSSYIHTRADIISAVKAPCVRRRHAGASGCGAGA